MKKLLIMLCFALFGTSNIYAQGIPNGRYEPVDCTIRATVVQAFIINGDNFTMVMPMVGTAMSLKYKYTNGTLTLTDNGQTASLPCSYDKTTETLVYSSAVCKKTSSKAEYNGIEEQKIAQENFQKYMGGCKETQPNVSQGNSENGSSGGSNNTSVFDENNVKYVYIINESKAVDLSLGLEWVTCGHNFIAFEDANGNGAVYSYGPIKPGAGGVPFVKTPARMWQRNFNKEENYDFQRTLNSGSFSLMAYKMLNNEEKYYDDVIQKFDRYIKIEIDSTNGKRMINEAKIYLRQHPDYGALVPGKKIGQCDNMTSEIADAGGKGYKVLSYPNWSFENIASSWRLSIYYVN